MFKNKDLPYCRLTFFLVPDEEVASKRESTSMPTPTPTPAPISATPEHSDHEPLQQQIKQEHEQEQVMIQEQIEKGETQIKKFKELMKYLADKVDSLGTLSVNGFSNIFSYSGIRKHPAFHCRYWKYLFSIQLLTSLRN